MSKSNRVRKSAPQRHAPVQARDSYANPLLRLGFGQNSLMEFSEYPITRRTRDRALMDSLYRNDWIASRIVDAVPEDMCKNWYRLEGVTPDQIRQYGRVERQTGVHRKIIEGLKWGRLYGGAAGIIMVEGQEDMLAEPIDYDMIMPGQFRGILIADRWSGVYPSTELVSDLSDPDFGLPEYYTFSMDSKALGYGVRVHHSRVLRFTGRELPYIERMTETYWGMSELEHVYEELTKRNSASANIAQLIFQANLRVLKMADLGETLAATSPQIQRDLYKTLSAQNSLMSNMGLQVMSKDDSFETHPYSFGGLSDVYELFMLDIAGAAEIPVTKLFGRSPAGMNATGESDLINYYDMIKQKQEATLRPVLDKLVPVICISTFGVMPGELEYEFEPVRDSSDQERAGLVQQTAAAVNSVFQSGIISQQTALKELRATQSFTGMWGEISEEEVARADDGSMPDLPAMGGIEGFPTVPPPDEGVTT